MGNKSNHSKFFLIGTIANKEIHYFDNNRLEGLTTRKLSFQIGENEARVATISFGNSAEVEFYLNENYNRQDLYNAIDAIQYKGENTNIYAGLHVLREEVLTKARGDRVDAPNMIVIFTDGISTMQSDLTISESIKGNEPLHWIPVPILVTYLREIILEGVNASLMILFQLGMKATLFL